MLSPIATPTRAAPPSPRRRKIPKGKFWIGKSDAALLADSTQLCTLESWVSSRTGFILKLFTTDAVAQLFHRQRFHRMQRDFKSSTGSVNEHDPNETANRCRVAVISSRVSLCWRHSIASE